LITRPILWFSSSLICNSPQNFDFVSVDEASIDAALFDEPSTRGRSGSGSPNEKVFYEDRSGELGEDSGDDLQFREQTKKEVDSVIQDLNGEVDGIDGADEDTVRSDLLELKLVEDNGYFSDSRTIGRNGKPRGMYKIKMKSGDSTLITDVDFSEFLKR